MLKVLSAIAIVFVVLIGAGVAVVTQTDVLSKLQGPHAGMGEPVQLVPATYGDLKRTVGAPGSIEPKTMARISSQVSAEVLALPFREGDSVKRGDVLVRLDPQDLEARLDAVKASLKAEQARLLGAQAAEIRARLQFERQTSLFETGDVAKSVLENAEADYKTAQSNVKAIEASIERAEADIAQVEKDLENTTIAAPMDGIIQQLNTEVGETVIVGTTNNPGSVIMEIADLSEMLLIAQVDEANIEPVREGQEAIVYINAYDDRPFTGTVSKRGLKRQVAADGTGYFEIEIAIDADETDRLFSGLTASTDIVVESFYDVIVVPSQAVVERLIDEQPRHVRESELVPENKTHTHVVYVEQDGKAYAKPVQTGPSSLTQTAVFAGLEEGELVVAGPVRVLTTIAHDQPIRDRDAAPVTPGGSGPVAGEVGETESGESAPSEGEGEGGSESETDDASDDTAAQEG
ncbi:MAG: efflux RND transporter periplasmic adaptor subunit [Phycisphaerales bacterium JB040]